MFSKTNSILLMLVAVIAFSFIFYGNTARAEETNLTTSQIESIRSSCAGTESTLGQLHSNDALLRVNVGQAYESISTRLIKRFNSRVAYNNLNNSALILASDNYDKSLDAFRNSYRDYETSLSELIATDCQNNPTDFYNHLIVTRDKRLAVRKNIELINGQLQNYADNVNAFEVNYRTVAEQNES